MIWHYGGGRSTKGPYMGHNIIGTPALGHRLLWTNAKYVGKLNNCTDSTIQAVLEPPAEPANKIFLDCCSQEPVMVEGPQDQSPYEPTLQNWLSPNLLKKLTNPLLKRLTRIPQTLVVQSFILPMKGSDTS